MAKTSFLPNPARIKVIGLGGGGCNTITRIPQLVNIFFITFYSFLYLSVFCKKKSAQKRSLIILIYSATLLRRPGSVIVAIRSAVAVDVYCCAVVSINVISIVTVTVTLSVERNQPNQHQAANYCQCYAPRIQSACFYLFSTYNVLDIRRPTPGGCV